LRVIASVYTNYTTDIVETGDMEPRDAFVASPKGNKVILRFVRAK